MYIYIYSYYICMYLYTQRYVKVCIIYILPFFAQTNVHASVYKCDGQRIRDSKAWIRQKRSRQRQAHRRGHQSRPFCFVRHTHNQSGTLQSHVDPRAIGVSTHGLQKGLLHCKLISKITTKIESAKLESRLHNKS